MRSVMTQENWIIKTVTESRLHKENLAFGSVTDEYGYIETGDLSMTYHHQYQWYEIIVTEKYKI